MSDSPFETQVFGDGVLTISQPNQKEDDEMSQVDLSPNVANQLLTESVGNIQADNRNSRAIATAAHGSLTGGIARVHNELSPQGSRAVSGLMATPIASPAVQQPAG